MTFAHYDADDAAAEAYAMVSLVEQGGALQTEVARAFGCDVRTVRRNQRRVEEGGLAALGRPDGYPKGRPRIEIVMLPRQRSPRTTTRNSCSTPPCLRRQTCTSSIGPTKLRKR